MPSDAAEFAELHEALDAVVQDADSLGKRALQAGSTLVFAIASEALQTAAKAVFALLDSRENDSTLPGALDDARAGLASARTIFGEAERKLVAGELSVPRRTNPKPDPMEMGECANQAMRPMHPTTAIARQPRRRF